MPNFDPLTYRYSSRRNVVYAKNGVCCTSVPLGAQVGLDVLKNGGNAVDAAVAMAGAMPLLEPTGNGLGSDCFALVWIEKEKKLYGLNASGVAPMALSADEVRAKGFSEVPEEGWLPTMVPGAPAGWAALNARFGTKPLSELFAPAISYAENGYAVPVNVGKLWARDSRRIARVMAQDPAPYEYWWKSFMKPDGSPYRAGDVFRFPAYADTMRSLVETNCESYYRGELMERIVAHSRATGGYFCEDAFKYLDSHDDKYDLIILDPPAFAKHRGALRNALKGYTRLNVKGFQRIRKGGILFTFSCSQVVSKEHFRQAVFTAAAQAGRKVRILHQLHQPADHPINIYHPEGEYLKGLVLYVE